MTGRLPAIASRRGVPPIAAPPAIPEILPVSGGDGR
jgi:hypothetical protein